MSKVLARRDPDKIEQTGGLTRKCAPPRVQTSTRTWCLQAALRAGP